MADTEVGLRSTQWPSTAVSAVDGGTGIVPSKGGEAPDIFGDDEEEEAVSSRMRGAKSNGSRIAELVKDDEADGEDDLFGDDPEDGEDVPSKRRLDDEELDSGDDEGRVDRAATRTPEAEAEPEREELVQYSEIGRQPVPEPSDGEMYLLKVPKFLAIEPSAFDTPSFQVPEREHHSRQEPPSTFSAFNTATSTIRWRHSPSEPEQLQSNARILRWSDGSLTLQLASDPAQQYEIDGNALAPPQKNPIKPNPITSKPATKQETYTYLTVPHESVGLLRVTHKITAGLSVFPSQKTTDDALVKLQTSLAAAVRGKTAHNGSGIEIMAVTEDPELGRKKAELAEKEKQRAQKRREAAENRDRDRSNRALGRSGLSSSRYGGGLNAAMLEDEEGGQIAPRQKKAAKNRSRRNDEYSSDEDLGRRRGNFANDDYEVDDFVAGSDEEEEIGDDDDEEEEEDVDDGIDLKRGGEKRREREDEVDAEGEDDDEVRASAPKAKKRRAVLDDDEDE